MTAICVIGIELSARTQVGLLGAEILTLALFAVVALVKVATGDAGPDAVDPSLSWLNPLEIDSFDALVSGVLIAIFIYWGWDSTVTVNEESRDSNEGPGKAALPATVILLLIYVIVAFAAQAYGGDAAADRQRRRRAERARRAGLRLAARQDPDHRRAHLGGRLDPDDDPPDRAHEPLDGARRRDAGVARAGPPALPHAPRLDDPDGRALDRLVRRPDDREREHPVRLDRRARADDRLLLRPDRVRVHDLLPAPGAQVGQVVLPDRRRADARRADPGRASSSSRASTSPSPRTPSPATRGSASGRRW